MKNNSKAELGEGGEDSGTIEVLVCLPDKRIKKLFHFDLHDKVWAAKLQVIGDLTKGVKDAINYGFYDPPCNGKSGKFLEEERTFADYPLSGSPPLLEFIYKRRVYRSLGFDQKTLQRVNAKPNQRKLFELISLDAVSQVAKLGEKGLDPNFQDEKTGETPLTVAVGRENANEMIITLVNFGALLDYRNRDGLTPLHKASMAGRAQSVKTLLDFGAAPNYKDNKGLTPLFYTVLCGGDPYCCEILLNDRAELQISDHQGMQEIHLACKNGLVQHLEHLLLYGAEIDARTASGNTALHIAALSNKEECARVLLFRGAKRNILNYANQSAYEVAAVGGNKDLAELIRSFTDRDIVKFSGKPTYSTRRRKSVSKPKASSLFPRTSSEPQLSVKSDSSPPSPVSSTHSVPSTTSETTSVDEPSGNMNGDVSAASKETQYKMKRTLSISSANSDSSYGSESDSGELSPRETKPIQERTWRQFSAPDISEKAMVPPVKAVSGAATMRKRLYASVPGKKFVAVRDYKPLMAGELALEKGDEVEVLYVGEKGFWEGRVGNVTGWFHHSCVEEKKRKGKVRPKTLFGRPPSVPASLGKGDSQDLNYLGLGRDQVKAASRVVSLKRTYAGFGFQMRGANSQVPRLNFEPTPEFPALQYIGEVEKGGEAELNGVKSRDFILEVNGEDVTTATHAHVVDLIKASGNSVTLRIITAKDPQCNGTDQTDAKGPKLPPPLPERDPSTTLTLGRMSRLSSSRPSLFGSEVSIVDSYEEPTNYRVDSVITVSKENRWHSLQRQKPHARKPVGVQMKGQDSVKSRPSNSSDSGRAAGQRSVSLQNIMPPSYEAVVGRRPITGVVPVATPKIPGDHRLPRSISEDNTASLLRRSQTSKSTPNLENSGGVSLENGHHSPREEGKRDVAYNRPFSYVASRDYKTRAASSDDVTIVATPLEATVVAVESTDSKPDYTCTVVATPVDDHELTPRLQRSSSETAVPISNTQDATIIHEKPLVPPKPISLSDALQEAVAARAARLNRKSSGPEAEVPSPTKLSDPWERKSSAPSRFTTRKNAEPSVKVRHEIMACLEENVLEDKPNSPVSEKPLTDRKSVEISGKRTEKTIVSRNNLNGNDTVKVVNGVRRVTAPGPLMSQTLSGGRHSFDSASSADIYRRYTSPPTSPIKEMSRQESSHPSESARNKNFSSEMLNRQLSYDEKLISNPNVAFADPKLSAHVNANMLNKSASMVPVVEPKRIVDSNSAAPPPPPIIVKSRDVLETPVTKALITPDALAAKRLKLKSSKKAEGTAEGNAGASDASMPAWKHSAPVTVERSFSSQHSSLLAKAVAERAARMSTQSRSENDVSGTSQSNDTKAKHVTSLAEQNNNRVGLLEVRGVNSRGQASPPVAPKKRYSTPALREVQRNRSENETQNRADNTLSPTKRTLFSPSRSPGERALPFEIPTPVLSEEDKTMMLLDEVIRKEAESENWSLNSWNSSDSSSEMYLPPPVWCSEQTDSDERNTKPWYECKSHSEESIPRASPTERLNKTVTTKKGLQITLTFEANENDSKEPTRTLPLTDYYDNDPVEPVKPTFNEVEHTRSHEASSPDKNGVRQPNIDSEMTPPLIGTPTGENSFKLPPPPPISFTDSKEPFQALESPPLPPPPEFCLTGLDEYKESREDFPSPRLSPVAVNQNREGAITFTDISSIFGFSRPEEAFLDKPVLDWDCDDVCNWLDSIKMPQYKETFRENDIRGSHLPDLTKAELKELGVKSLGHRMTLENAIARLSQPLESNC